MARQISPRFPEIFSRPEVQLHFQTNVVHNNLSITIAPQEIKQIESIAEPVRQSVKALYAAYRPNQGNGGQETNGSTSVREKFANYRAASGNGE